MGTVIENVQAGSGNDTVIGNASHNVIWGNIGDDYLNGGSGNDTLIGGAGQDRLVGNTGNDVYRIDSLDTITEAANGGRDLVQAGFSVTLGANLEELLLTGNGGFNATGNTAANTLTGNMNANELRGLDGNDILAGQGGNDSMWGGAGADTFLFNQGRDEIWDFQNDVDTIQFDDALWGGAPRTVAQLIAAATVVDGDTVFRFGSHVLTVDNVANIQALTNDLIIV